MKLERSRSTSGSLHISQTEYIQKVTTIPQKDLGHKNETGHWGTIHCSTKQFYQEDGGDTGQEDTSFSQHPDGSNARDSRPADVGRCPAPEASGRPYLRGTKHGGGNGYIHMNRFNDGNPAPTDLGPGNGSSSCGQTESQAIFSTENYNPVPSCISDTTSSLGSHSAPTYLDTPAHPIMISVATFEVSTLPVEQSTTVLRNGKIIPAAGVTTSKRVNMLEIYIAS